LITRVYIDGYNFYYGCLKGTPYKWLDIVKLFENHILCRPEAGAANLHDNGIKYFTAEITDRAAGDPNSVNDQRSYHQAIYHHNKKLSTIKGNYAVDEVKCYKVECDANGDKKDPKDSSKVEVWKLEEKQSDVNVAVEAVYDAITDPDLEQIVFVTNDTDIVPALKKIQTYNALAIRKPIIIGLVTPAKEGTRYRKTNKSLSDLADWTISFIKNSELMNSQLPCRVASKRTVAIKPISWFEHSQEVSEIVEILSASDVLGSIPKAWHWLSSQPIEVSGLPILKDCPANLLDCKQDIADVLMHVKAFSKYKIHNNKTCDVKC
jgi:hypothetical protein